jgi:hypothetical protein
MKLSDICTSISDDAKPVGARFRHHQCMVWTGGVDGMRKDAPAQRAAVARDTELVIVVVIE